MTAPNATPQQATVAIAVESSAVARSGPAAWVRAGASSGSGQATARPTAENTAAATKSAGKPPSRTSCSPSVGASAWVASVETPKRPRAAARRPSGANSAASVEAALKPAAKASPCTARSTKIPDPMRSTRRKAPAAADMVASPASRKMRRPKRSRSAPTASTLTRPARPLVPITRPIVRSVPPSARTCSGKRKNDAKVRKKQKFAPVTRAKQAVRVEGDMGRSARRGLPRRAAHYTDRAWRRNDGASSAGAAPPVRRGAPRAPPRRGTGAAAAAPPRRRALKAAPTPRSGAYAAERCLRRGAVLVADDAGQDDAEAAAAPERAGDLDRAAEPGDELLHDVEPEAHAAVAARRRAVHLAEHVEDDRQVLGADADARVAHLDHHRLVMQQHAYQHLPLAGELEGVAHQVADHERELGAVGHDALGEVRGRLPLEGHAVRARQAGRARAQRLEEVAERHGGYLDHVAAGLEAAHVQRRLDQLDQLAPARVEAVDQLALAQRDRADGGPAQHLGV